MINWLLETVSLIMVMIEESVFVSILYLLVTSCGTPLVYIFRTSLLQCLQTDVLGLLSWHRGEQEGGQGTLTIPYEDFHKGSNFSRRGQQLN